MPVMKLSKRMLSQLLARLQGPTPIAGSMIDQVPVETQNAALIEEMADPAIRTMALTVTEGGYDVALATQGFDAVHPAILHDVANPNTPRTAFGAMRAYLGG